MLQWTLGYMCLLELWFSQGICPIVGLLGHMVILFLAFKEISILFPIVAAFTLLPTVQEGSLFSTSSPEFIVCRFFDDGHTDWCEVVSHCSFDLHFSNKVLLFLSNLRHYLLTSHYGRRGFYPSPHIHSYFSFLSICLYPNF